MPGLLLALGALLTAVLKSDFSFCNQVRFLSTSYVRAEVRAGAGRLQEGCCRSSLRSVKVTSTLALQEPQLGQLGDEGWGTAPELSALEAHQHLCHQQESPVHMAPSCACLQPRQRRQRRFAGTTRARGAGPRCMQTSVNPLALTRSCCTIPVIFFHTWLGLFSCKGFSLENSLS